MDGCDLDTALEHELKCAARYRRYVSVVVAQPLGPLNGLMRDLAGAARDTDLVFRHGEAAVMVMTETPFWGAVHAVKRFTELPELQAAHYGIAAYPKDGHRGEELLEVAQRRVAFLEKQANPAGSE